MRARTIRLSIARGTWWAVPELPFSGPISGTSMISSASPPPSTGLPWSRFMRSALAIGVDSPWAMSLVT